MSSTRERILDLAREQIEQRDGEPLNMSALASEVGISRQALYLHFADRASLMLALVERVDDQEDITAWLGHVWTAPDGVTKLRRVFEMQAGRNPRIAGVVRSLDHARRTDPASEEAWRDRMNRRLGGMTAIAESLIADGHVDPSWSLEEAALLIWQMASFHAWDDLVTDRGIPPERYIELMLHTTLTALATARAPERKAPAVAPSLASRRTPQP